MRNGPWRNLKGHTEIVFVGDIIPSLYNTGINKLMMFHKPQQLFEQLNREYYSILASYHIIYDILQWNR